MTEGYISDVDGCEKVMDVPDGGIRIHLNELPPMQGERLAIYLSDSGVGELDESVMDDIRTCVRKGKQYGGNIPTAHVHLDLQNIIMILNNAQIADIPTGEDTVEGEDLSTTNTNEEL